MLYVKFGKNRLHGFRGDDVWKCWRTTDACLYYKLTYEPWAQVSYKGKMLPFNDLEVQWNIEGRGGGSKLLRFFFVQFKVYVHASVYANVCCYAFVCTHTHVPVRAYVCVCVRVCMCALWSLCCCAFACARIRACACVCVAVCDYNNATVYFRSFVCSYVQYLVSVFIVVLK